ncbi:MAG: hypothetical protein IPK44_10975 [Candidatus Accumulibacter sp.]|jgi:hypothetical protein|uniref:hypothetical protein n=1 Tax=Accumulibacter sp. TaxID=2053492 RepID=UPI00258F8B50|nr:hypothetical protein [Accumulibacter sp.]MBK8115019.1 hypothetical protein [Accumulibacter sp.]MBK8385660.1 hypothetical protein [Accumulibacter sp.]
MILPQQYLDAVSPFFRTALDTLKKGERLHPAAFLGSFSTGQTIPIVFSGNSDDEKDGWAYHIKQLAAIYAADYICVLMESWSLPQKHAHLYKDILHKYGSVGASPYAQDVISISIETPTSIWMSQRPIRLLPPSKKRRAFDLPAAGDFQRYTEAAGRFSGLLPNSQLIDPTSG